MPNRAAFSPSNNTTFGSAEQATNSSAHCEPDEAAQWTTNEESDSATYRAAFETTIEPSFRPADATTNGTAQPSTQYSTKFPTF